MMFLNTVILVIFFLSGICDGNDDDGGENDFGANLIAEMRNDANLDLSVDEEYEDLRAELLAYHTTLAKLSSARRSMMTTPCWQMGGICINDKLCRAQHGRYMTQVLGCRDKLNVCCFAWNRFKVKDVKEQGIDNVLPWSIKYEAGGRGIVSLENVKPKVGKKKKGKLKAIQMSDTKDDNQREVIADDDDIREDKIVRFDGNDLYSSLSSEQISISSSSSNLDRNPNRKDIKMRNNRHTSTGGDNSNALAHVLKGIRNVLL